MTPPIISISALVTVRFVAWKSLYLCTRLLDRSYLSGWAFVFDFPLAAYPVSHFEMTDTNGDTNGTPMVACTRIFHRLYGFLRCGRHKMAEQKKAHIYRPHRLTSHSPSQSSELLFASHFTTHDDPISNWIKLNCFNRFSIFIFRFRNRFLRKNSNLLNKTVQILSLHNKRSIKINKRKTKWMAGRSVRDKYVKSKRYWSDGSSSELRTRFKICPVLMYLLVATVFGQ